MSAAPTLCTACQHEQTALPEPARTGLLVVVAFAAGVLYTGFMHEREAAGQVCFAREYSNVNETKE